MARKREGTPIHGWLVIDKAEGVTSSRVVARVKRLTGAAKAGHGGTLDPMATGILPIALGEATKTVSYVVDGLKEYRFTIAWGESRDSDDKDGQMVETSPERPEKEQILRAVENFVGDFEQIPPAFSAIKIEGRRAYDLARAGAAVDLAPRRVHVARFTLEAIPDCDHATFTVLCGKGTYIRGLARDLSQHMGCLGHVAALRRTRVGRFGESLAISVDLLESLGHIAALEKHLLPVETVLDDIPALALTEDQAVSLRNGQAVPLFRVKPARAGGKAGTAPEGAKDDAKDDADLCADFLEEVGKGPMACALSGGRLVALVRCQEGRLHPVRVFNF